MTLKTWHSKTTRQMILWQCQSLAHQSPAKADWLCIPQDVTHLLLATGELLMKIHAYSSLNFTADDSVAQCVEIQSYILYWT